MSLSKRLVPARYQLNKEAQKVAMTGHPWIFRSHLSTAAEVFKQGQWLRLVGGANQPVGYGIYEREGLIGVRLLKLGQSGPDREWIHKQINKAIVKREALRKFTSAYRAINGENDNLPGIVVDIYGDTAVLQTYVESVDVLGRYVAKRLCHDLSLANVLWKIPDKRKGKANHAGVRVLRGHTPRKVTFREGKLNLAVDLSEGQKSGAFLDLRGLRKWLAAQPLQGRRVLNLFSYTGTLGLACEVAGASEIWNVDISQGALDFSKKHHALDAKRHRWISADIFEWLKKLDHKEKFDLVIVDPPQMAARTDQVPNALRAYRLLHQLALQHLKSHGKIVTACCTSRIARKRFQMEVEKVLKPEMTLEKSILPEDDHPVAFDEGDYLKILVYRRY